MQGDLEEDVDLFGDHLENILQGAEHLGAGLADMAEDVVQAAMQECGDVPPVDRASSAGNPAESGAEIAADDLAVLELLEEQEAVEQGPSEPPDAGGAASSAGPAPQPETAAASASAAAGDEVVEISPAGHVSRTDASGQVRICGRVTTWGKNWSARCSLHRQCTWLTTVNHCTREQMVTWLAAGRHVPYSAPQEQHVAARAEHQACKPKKRSAADSSAAPSGVS